MRKSVLVTVFLITGVCLPTNGFAEAYASPERMKVATGHYARARAMLVDALAEFDQAMSLASPDMLLDSEEWRLSVISRTEELNRVLDPKPRVSRHGVRFDADRLHVQQQRNKAPIPTPEPYTASYVGEDELQARKKAKKLKEIAERNLEESRAASPEPYRFNPAPGVKVLKNEPLPRVQMPEKESAEAFEAQDETMELGEPSSRLAVEEPQPPRPEAEEMAVEESIASEQQEAEMEKTVESMLKERMLQLQKEQRNRGAR